MFDNALFIGFPYAAVSIALVVTIYRFFFDPYSVSSQSSQFLENRTLFFGSVPWHYGVVIILLAHLTAFLLPGAWGAFTANQARLYALEVLGMTLAVQVSSQAQGKKDVSIAEVMKVCMKGGLCAKVASGKASDDEKKQLIALFTSLHAATPPKGDAASWKAKTEALLEASRKGDGAALKAAANCAGCHKAHK